MGCQRSSFLLSSSPLDVLGVGLEVRVALGGVWKQSLTELSGGQRSLLALSLILAMLKYQPAPFYILDEVPSHTPPVCGPSQQGYTDTLDSNAAIAGCGQ